ncbi:MAG: hypothetical protein WCW40_00315 [Bacteroidota bacterium]
MEFKRRQFLTTSATILSCAALGTGLQSCGIGGLLYSSNDIPVTEGDPTIDLAATPELRTIGGAVKKRFSRVNDGSVIIIVRNTESTFHAFAAQCTHWGAEIGLPQQTNIMVAHSMDHAFLQSTVR